MMIDIVVLFGVKGLDVQLMTWAYSLTIHES